jgi:hypothetical protein
VAGRTSTVVNSDMERGNFVIGKDRYCPSKTAP